MTTTDTRTVYVGSLWHRDCDPFATVIGFDAAEVGDKLRELDWEEYNRCLWESADEVNIMTGGVHAEPFKDIADLDAILGLADEARDELETDGITVV